MTWEIRQGDALERLREMEAESVQTVVTSPPYWSLRDYQAEGQLGLEDTSEEYVANLVGVFREVRRVMRQDATAWLNLGDSFNGKQLTGIPWKVAFALQVDGWWLRSEIIWAKKNCMPESVTDRPTRAHEQIFLLTKSARYFYDADAIREEHGSTVVDRPLVHVAPKVNDNRNDGGLNKVAHSGGQAMGFHPAGRNRRSVWEIATAPYPEAHFATFPPKLVEPCILAGSPPKCCGECGAPWERVVERGEQVASGPNGLALKPRSQDRHVGDGLLEDRPSDGWGDLPRWENKTLGWCSTCPHDDDSGRSVVLDPFCGSGTTGVVALRHDRSFLGIELNESYCELARNRIRDDAPLLNHGLEVAA